MFKDNKYSNFEEELKKVQDEKLSKKDIYDLNVIQPKVMRYATYKMRTKQEILRKFEKEFNEISNKSVDEILNYLKQNEIINDEYYAKTFLKEAINFKRNSKFELKMKLKEKGIDEGYIYDAFNELESELNDFEETLILKILKEKKNQDEKKVIAYLYRKGFDSENIRKARQKFEEE